VVYVVDVAKGSDAPAAIGRSERGTRVTAYVVRRLLLVIPTILIASVLVFIVIRLIPGDVIDRMVDEQGFGQVDREALEKALGLDVPIYVQYFRWLGVAPNASGQFKGILQGSLGKSLWKPLDVTELIGARLPVTFELGLLAIVVALAEAFPIGIYSAIRQDTWTDYVGRTFAIGALAIPGFWLAIMVLVYGSILANWSPPVIYVPFAEDPAENLAQFIVPALIMGFAMAGVTMRMTRTMMLEVLRQDYIRTAWSKGLRERVIILRHALKNAMIPVITIIGLQLPVVVGGSVIMEQIFTLPGMGRLMLDAAFQRDYTVLTGVMLVIAVVILLCNLLIDLSYAWLDPRVHYK
jgi:peptide/nickel transport system permease protein